MPPPRPPADGEQRFFADAMLGRLARWMRIAGLDVAYEAHIEDGALVRRALEQGRVVLTRDARMLREWRIPRAYLVRSDRVREQLAEVLDAFDLQASMCPLSRCSLCNARLVPAGAEHVGGVPEHVRATSREMLRCPDCDRIYWRGSHTDRIETVLHDLTPRRYHEGTAADRQPERS